MQNIQPRLEKLTEQSERKFGIMSPQHMLEHLILTVKLSYGRIKIPDFEPTEKQLAQKQALLYSEIQFPIGVKAPGLGDKLLDLRFPDLSAAKAELLKSINEYLVFFENNPNEQTIHPRFGKLTFTEWELFHRKHFDHHLSQFGV
ncbi:DUF1569 domain-containing protein [Algoriphagus litoralis]|uniref:DUF1569 domain-containing protein n=1 Tax=Algoriphagus litoralis TaxID=2202829 RepID=UPI000DB9B0A6|nr:DUF1569 domain-containing protein [Algoriphagus litoralis]